MNFNNGKNEIQQLIDAIGKFIVESKGVKTIIENDFIVSALTKIHATGYPFRNPKPDDEYYKIAMEIIEYVFGKIDEKEDKELFIERVIIFMNNSLTGSKIDTKMKMLLQAIAPQQKQKIINPFERK